MRPLEIVLVAAELAAVLALLIGPRVAGRARHLALLVLPIGLAQVLIEGPRWQLAGLYLLGAVLLAAWLVRTVRPRRRRPGRRGTVVLAVLGVIGVTLASVLPVAAPVFTIPSPTGPYAIGTRTYHWIDHDRADAFAGAAGARREVVGQLWYPAEPGTSGATSAYIDDPAVVGSIAETLGMPRFGFSHFSQVRTHSVPAAPALNSRQPVLIFVHGRGGYRQHNTRQVEELASRGYAVLSLDLPGAASGVVLSDGRVAELDPRMSDRSFVDEAIPALAEDVSFAVDRLAELDQAGPLAGRLDLDRIGLFGLSLGGAITAETCRGDERIKACLPIDNFMPASVVRDGLSQPTLWLTRDSATMRREGWPQPEVDEALGTMRTVFDRHGPGAYLARIPGMYHLDFSDGPLVSPLTGVIGMSGPIDQDRGREIVDAVTFAFFDHELRGSAATMRQVASDYPELMIEIKE